MKEAYVKQSQSSSVKNTVSEETEIFDPEIDFGEWRQQDGGVGSPPSHASTETVTLILKHLEEKFSIQPGAGLGGAQTESPHISTGTEN